MCSFRPRRYSVGVAAATGWLSIVTCTRCVLLCFLWWCGWWCLCSFTRFSLMYATCWVWIRRLSLLSCLLPFVCCVVMCFVWGRCSCISIAWLSYEVVTSVVQSFASVYSVVPSTACVTSDAFAHGANVCCKCCWSTCCSKWCCYEFDNL